MELKAVRVFCNQCGAPIDAPESARFITCANCASPLEMKLAGGAYFTTAVPAPRTPQPMALGAAREVAILRVENELQRIDHEWQMERSQLMFHTKYGRAYEPGSASAITAYTIMIVFGFAVIFAKVLLGVLIIAVFALLLLVDIVGGSTLRQAQQRYLERRQACLEKLDQAKRDRLTPSEPRP